MEEKEKHRPAERKDANESQAKCSAFFAVILRLDDEHFFIRLFKAVLSSMGQTHTQAKTMSAKQKTRQRKQIFIIRELFIIKGSFVIDEVL